MLTDAELLHRYAGQKDERAFAELVERHLGWVYAAAWRSVDGQAHLAEEIVQKVFTDLARKAPALRSHPALAGWLHRTARYAALDARRAEHRRRNLAQAFAVVTTDLVPPDPPVDWERLRSVIDEALDQLKETDRAVVLLRFFNGLTFAEIGARTNLPENTARMRTERALDKLRRQLGRRGITSTTAALGLLLANQTLAAPPAGLAAAVTTTAVSAGPMAAGWGATLLMSKIVSPLISAALAAGLTAIVWVTAVPGIDAHELAALRQENLRLTAAVGPAASAGSVAAVAEQYEAETGAQVAAIAGALEKRQAAAAMARPGQMRGPDGASTSNPVAGGHRNRGRARPHDAYMSMAWASDAGEVAELAQLLWFDDRLRAKAERVWSALPESIRTQYRTPEELYAFFFAADALVAPPPGADVIEGNIVEELGPGRVVIRRPGAPPQQYDQQFQQTPDGWKYVVPEVAVDNMPNVLANETLAKLVRPSPSSRP